MVEGSPVIAYLVKYGAFFGRHILKIVGYYMHIIVSGISTCILCVTVPHPCNILKYCFSEVFLRRQVSKQKLV